MIIVGWNIRAGGGRRIESIAKQLARWDADVVALSEFRGTPASVWLANALRDEGLAHQLSSVSTDDPARNSVFVASRWPVERIALSRLPRPSQRFLPVRIAADVPFSLLAVHGPLGAMGLRRPFNDRILAMLKHWRHDPGLLIGDTNTGKRGIDGESPVFDARDDAWMDGMARAGWPDAYRHLHGDERVYTWYSPNKGNGFRLDEAFVNHTLLDRVTSVRYEFTSDGGGRRDAVSDHAAIILALAEQQQPSDDEAVGDDGTSQHVGGSGGA
jgi:exonuclease III